MNICSKCKAQSPDNTKFCGFCGTQFEELDNTKVCPMCQTQVANIERFCTNCGYSFYAQVQPSPLLIMQAQEPTEQSIDEPYTLFGTVKMQLTDFWTFHPIKAVIIIALILLIPLCCISFSAFTMVALQNNPETATPTVTPSTVPTNTSVAVLQNTPTATNTLVPFTPTVFLTPTTEMLAEPTQTTIPPIPEKIVCSCNCSGKDLGCKDFRSRWEAQFCFDCCKPLYGDIFKLDTDNNSLVCEEKK